MPCALGGSGILTDRNKQHAFGTDRARVVRAAGIKSSLEKLYSLFEEHGHQPGTVDTSYEPDINVLTGCLKMFFRQVRPPGAGFKRVAPPASAYARARELSASDPSLWRHHLAP